MVQKEVKVKVATDVDLKKVEALEDHVRKLKAERLQLKIEAETNQLNTVTQKLQEAESELTRLQSMKTVLNLDVDDGLIDKAAAEVQSLREQKINLEIAVESDKLDAAKDKVEELDDTNIDIQLNNQSAMDGIEQISQGFDRLKQGASEIGQEMGAILDQAGQAEQNQAFLKIGYDKAGSKNALEDAKKAQGQIQDIVSKAPGDDVAMNSILSSAVAKDVSLMDKDMQGFANSVSDYFAGAEVNGKAAAEAIQDVRSYINSGNVAELESTGVFDAEQLEQLKNIDSVGERVAKFQEMINQSAYSGLGTADTLTNKFAEFDGMMAQSQTKLGGFFSDATKGVLDFALNLNDATGGLAGMALAGLNFAGPVADGVMGLGQMATGMKAIKDLGMIKYLKDLEIMTKLSAAADWLLSGAQGVLNAVMSMNPIVLVVLALVALAAALVWAYYNVDWFREMVDNAWASLQQFAGQLMGAVTSAIQWIGGLFNNFTSQLGLNSNDWIQSILGFILFVATLPMQIGMYLLNTLASALGFGNNFVQTMINTAINSVMGFLTYIASLPGRLWNYLSNALARAINFASSLPNTLYNAASNAVSRFTSAIQGIGTALKNCLDWAVNVIMSHPLVQKLAWLGQQAANAFAVIGLGQSSPGKIVKAMRQELEWTEEAVEGSNLSKTTASLGNDLSNSFNPNFETGTVNGILGSTGRAGQVVNINLEIGSVDDEKRIDEIVDAVRKALAWNNKTAGRTV